MSYKRLTPCIFIRGGKAVKWFDDSLQSSTAREARTS